MLRLRIRTVHILYLPENYGELADNMPGLHVTSGSKRLRQRRASAKQSLQRPHTRGTPFWLEKLSLRT